MLDTWLKLGGAILNIPEGGIRRIRKLCLGLGAVFCLLNLIFVNPVRALGSPGLSVSPAIEQVTSQAGQSSLSFNVTLLNETTGSLTISISTRDFTSLNEDGAVSFYGNNYNSALNPHGLAAFMKPSVSQLTLSGNQQAVLTVSVANLKALAAGGHYGALQYFVAYTPTGPGISAKVNENQVLSTLVFLTTASGGTQSLSLGPPLLSSFYVHPPKSVQLVLTNTGNTQTVPRGYVTEIRGQTEVARGLINSGSGLILPSGAELFTAPLNQEAKYSFWGGHYRLNFYYRSGTQSGFTLYSRTYLLIGVIWLWLVPSAIILLILFTFFRRYRKRKRFYS